MVVDNVVRLPVSATKRDGRSVDFELSKISRAIELCFRDIAQEPITPIDELVRRTSNILAARYDNPTVEDIQDVVEFVLQSAGEYAAAKHYILYRAEHTAQRHSRPIPQEVANAFADAKQYFPTPLQEFQYYDKYARFNYDLGRRETWPETVDRAVSFLHELAGDRIESEIYMYLRSMILEMRSMPSMRLLAMAGAAARRNNLTIYNCSYLPVDSIDSFVEALIISMSGCGVGFSVERQYVEEFPRVVRQRGGPRDLIIIEDSSEGWASALRAALDIWFSGGDVEFDYSQLRPAGTPLRIKGGRASGADPLRQVLDFIRARILSRQGSFLRPLDAHDIMCAVGNAAVSGGVRRTAMLSLFDFDDDEMATCKRGNYDNYRWNANNSAVWPAGITQQRFLHQFVDMVDSNNGEPGIFNRSALINQIPNRRPNSEWGTNPCGEIILRPFELCNLSIAVARADDTYETLMQKVEAATIIGTIQSMATNFPGLRREWKTNCEEERLLGVDINGQLDCPIIQDTAIMRKLQNVVLETNQTYAKALGINRSTATTCVKPGGNSSVLLDCSSGLHPRWSPYYVRNVRVSTHSPIFKVLQEAGAPMDPENGQLPESATTWVVHFPVRAPENAQTRHDRSALQQCAYWLDLKLNWTEHNPSVTITYKPEELLDLAKWIWENKDVIGGMSFLPTYDAEYDQLPNVEITQEEYERRVAAFPPVDWSKLYRYELEDYSEASQEVACMGGACELKL